MPAKYLLRFDDICETMDWDIWEEIEAILIERGIKPILAVIPKNVDPQLKITEANCNFWSKVKEWQDRGWIIAMHGYEHKYETLYGGILKISNKSEFSGLDYEIQKNKISKSLKIFNLNKIGVEAWIAPSHSFDATTLKVLREENVKIISDGFSYRIYQDDYFTWIPQQLWRFRWFPFGFWTVCLHHNSFNKRDLSNFKMNVEKYEPNIIKLGDNIYDSTPKRSYADRLFELAWQSLFHVKKYLFNKLFKKS
jgi:predicted deacetylase